MAKKASFAPWRRQPVGPAGINWGHPRAEGLVFFAPLSGAHGTLDLAKPQLGTRTGLEAYLPSQASAVHHLFGSSNYCDFPEVPAEIGATTPFTVAWTQEPRSTSAYSTILCVNFGTAGTHKQFLIYESATDSNYYFCAGAANGTSFATQAWTVVGAATNEQLDRFVLQVPGGSQSVSGSGMALWRNGELLTTGGGTTLGNNTAAGFRVGALSGATDPFEGLIGDLRLWARLLSDAESAQESTIVGSYELYAPRRRLFLVSAGGGGATITADLTESASATDAAIASYLAAASAAESITASDVAAALLSAVATLTEAASAADSQTTGNVQAAELSEAATATDTEASVTSLAAAVSEPATAADLAAAVALAVAAVSEAVSLTDSQSTSPIVVADLTEATLAVDAITAAALLVGALLESVTSADAATTAAQLVALLTEAASATDTITAPTVHSVSITELAAALDVLSAAIDGGAIDITLIRRVASSPALSRLVRSPAPVRSTDGL